MKALQTGSSLQPGKKLGQVGKASPLSAQGLSARFAKAGKRLAIGPAAFGQTIELGVNVWGGET
jgi:hypothetical protein